MVSSRAQPSATSISLEIDQRRASAQSERASIQITASESDLAGNPSITDKLKSGVQWIVDPIRRCHSSAAKTSKWQFDSRCLKRQYDQVNGLLKYFTFGVMFTNGILGFILFLVGLWSSFEHGKITRMPSVNGNEQTTLTPFNFTGIVVCIFGLLFFLLSIVSCLGVNRENLNLLRISLLGQLLTLLVFLISATIILAWGQTIRNKIGAIMISGLRTHYHVDEAWTRFFDRLHMSYFCCGVYSFNDWNDNLNYVCTSASVLQNPEACSVPFTCCKTPSKEVSERAMLITTSLIRRRRVLTRMVNKTKRNHWYILANVLPLANGTVNMNEIQERINMNGCFDEILPIIQQLIITSAVFMLLICAIIFVTIFLTCILTFQIRLTKSDVQRYCAKTRYEKKQAEDADASEETF